MELHHCSFWILDYHPNFQYLSIVQLLGSRKRSVFFSPISSHLGCWWPWHRADQLTPRPPCHEAWHWKWRPCEVAFHTNPFWSVVAQVTLHQFASIGSETKILKRLEDRQLGECSVGATLFWLPHPINALQANKWKLLKFIDEFALWVKKAPESSHTEKPTRPRASWAPLPEWHVRYPSRAFAWWWPDALDVM